MCGRCSPGALHTPRVRASATPPASRNTRSSAAPGAQGVWRLPCCSDARQTRSAPSMRGAARSANRARVMTATRPDGPAAGWQRAGDTRPQYDQPPPRAPASQRFSHLRRWHSPPDLTSCFPPRCAELRFVNLNWPTSVVGVLEFVHLNWPTGALWCGALAGDVCVFDDHQIAARPALCPGKSWADPHRPLRRPRPATTQEWSRCSIFSY